MVKPSSTDHLNLENKGMVRKRRPIDFSLNELEDDEDKDETWNAKANGFKSPKAATDSASRTKKHILPRRSASSKIKFDQDMTDEETDEDYILEANQTPAINKQAKSSLEKVLNVFFLFDSSDELKGFYLLHQLWIFNYYVTIRSNNLSNEDKETGVSREMIFQKKNRFGILIHVLS